MWITVSVQQTGNAAFKGAFVLRGLLWVYCFCFLILNNERFVCVLILRRTLLLLLYIAVALCAVIGQLHADKYDYHAIWI